MAELISEKIIPVKFALYVNNIDDGHWAWMIVNDEGEEQWMSDYIFATQKEAEDVGTTAFEEFSDRVYAWADEEEEDESGDACDDTGKVPGNG